MKTIIKDALKKLISDRYLLILLSSLILLAIIISISVGLSIHPIERQVPSHYSAFGITHIYNDQWFYVLVFIAFQLMVAVLHSIVSIKLLLVKGHSMAVSFAWLGIGILLMGWATISMILDLRARL